MRGDVSVVVDKQKSDSSVLTTASDARCCLALGLFQLLFSNIKCQEADGCVRIVSV